jgi:acyl transferase domain-containing protein
MKMTSPVYPGTVPPSNPIVIPLWRKGEAALLTKPQVLSDWTKQQNNHDQSRYQIVHHRNVQGS